MDTRDNAKHKCVLTVWENEEIALGPFIFDDEGDEKQFLAMRRNTSHATWIHKGEQTYDAKILADRNMAWFANFEFYPYFYNAMEAVKYHAT